VSDKAVSGCSTELSGALRESGDNARTAFETTRSKTPASLRMHNLDNVQLILYSQVSLN
jgi:hypothetical protein